MTSTHTLPAPCEGWHRPDDDPDHGYRCTDCRRPVVWVGPKMRHWALAAHDDDSATVTNPITVTLSPEAAATIAGLLAPSWEGIHADGIHGPWGELRALFPVALFRSWVTTTGHPEDNPEGLGYDPHAGE